MKGKIEARIRKNHARDVQRDPPKSGAHYECESRLAIRLSEPDLNIPCPLPLIFFEEGAATFTCDGASVRVNSQHRPYGSDNPQMEHVVKLKNAIFGALALATLPLLAPAAANADAPHTRVLELRDACDKASWDAEFPGLCTKNAGSVSLPEFRADLAKGGSGAWWIRQRAIGLDQGDSVAATNVGGIVHTFTEVGQFGKGCVPEWNQAVSATAVDNCDFGKFVATIVPAGTSSAAVTPTVGVHKYQCLIHPWMQTTISVKA